MRVSKQKAHTEEPNDTGVTERIPWGPGAISPGRGLQRAATGPLDLRSSLRPREYALTCRMAHPMLSQGNHVKMRWMFVSSALERFSERS